VSKHFGDVHAVDRVSIDITRGEFFSLLGPSGCGKTTLLRMLAGLEFPTTGEIYIDGQAMSSVPANHRPVNMVFQNYAIFPHLNVKKNIGYSLIQDKLSKKEIDTRVGDMLELIKLPGYEERASHELSGGERQRVALARALIRRPKVLLLDEPLGALDKKLREEMQVELRQLQRTVGITFVFVTHDQEEALTMADRVAVMMSGQIVQIDTPGALYETPSCTAVAEFIGNINLLPGKVESIGDSVVIDTGPTGRLSVPAAQSQVSLGEEVALAVRPEKLRITDEPPASGYNGLRGKLIAESYAGDRSYYFLEVAGLARRVTVASLNEFPTSTRPGIDGAEEVWAVWPIESGLLLTS
jgi:spermidine/putrescine ABC transporter ATP-binding subunit